MTDSYKICNLRILMDYNNFLLGENKPELGKLITAIFYFVKKIKQFSFLWAAVKDTNILMVFALPFGVQSTEPRSISFGRSFRPLSPLIQVHDESKRIEQVFKIFLWCSCLTSTERHMNTKDSGGLLQTKFCIPYFWFSAIKWHSEANCFLGSDNICERGPKTVARRTSSEEIKAKNFEATDLEINPPFFLRVEQV